MSKKDIRECQNCEKKYDYKKTNTPYCENCVDSLFD
jgi:uncharacterized protein CbrC (UPF0167 family)